MRYSLFKNITTKIDFKTTLSSTNTYCGPKGRLVNIVYLICRWDNGINMTSN